MKGKLITGVALLLVVLILFSALASFPVKHEVEASDLGELERIELWNAGEFFLIITFHYERGSIRRTFWGVHHMIELRDPLKP